MTRLSTFLTAEELEEPYTIDADSQFAISVDGEFRWESAHKPSENTTSDEMKKAEESADKAKADAVKKRKAKGKKGKPELPTSAPQDQEKDEAKQAQEPEEKPFELKDLKLNIPKGAFVAVVGRVGSGKVSLSAGELVLLNC